MDTRQRGKVTAVEDAEVAKGPETWRLPWKKRSYVLMAAEVKTVEEGCGSTDSTEKVADDASLGAISEHLDYASNSDHLDCESCECCVESGYVADGEAEGLSYRWYLCSYSTVATPEEPACKRRADGNSEDTEKA